MTEELQKKVDRAIRLIQAAAFDDGRPVEVAYSGGKDSDVILELTRMAGIKYRAIYKNTTIDPPGTIRHARERGAEMLRPEKTFFQVLAENGMPNRYQRSCCRLLKEYKVLDRSIMGIRRCESTDRKNNYEEPTECRVYGKGRKKQTAEAFYPILDWTDEDVVAFIEERGIMVHPLYYREDGTMTQIETEIVKAEAVCCIMVGWLYKSILVNEINAAKVLLDLRVKRCDGQDYEQE